MRVCVCVCVCVFVCVCAGTESCIRLIDVDGDGVDDVIIGLALGRDVSTMVVESTMDKYCQEEGARRVMTSSSLD